MVFIASFVARAHLLGEFPQRPRLLTPKARTGKRCVTSDRRMPDAGATPSTDLVPGAGATPLPVQISSLSNVFMAPFIARACLVGELPQRPHSKSNEQQ